MKYKDGWGLIKNYSTAQSTLDACRCGVWVFMEQRALKEIQCFSDVAPGLYRVVCKCGNAVFNSRSRSQLMVDWNRFQRARSSL